MSESVDIYDAELQFADFATSHGYPTPKGGFQLDGKIHRFDIDGKKAVGAYQFWPDGKSHDGVPHAWLQDHRNAGDKDYWQYPHGDVNQSVVQAARARANSPEARAKYEADEKARQQKERRAIEKARKIYENANDPDPSHGYLVRKGVGIFGDMKQSSDKLVLPPTPSRPS